MAGLGPDSEIARIEARLDAEMAAFRTDTRLAQGSLAAFAKARIVPRAVTVNFSGGFAHRCYSVTRSDGTYRVIYMPRADYFALCVESVFGPLDIGVHGGAIECHSSV
ncbi:hypothetical protein [Pararhodobacter sp.]|uniref:hypothetical protein n=1 Tax=Pararhodobacter sp. TaxID=2127056 RepID=UPI002AFFA8C6|nr:hypothetical protein [Pararhodobacter sp.]